MNSRKLAVARGLLRPASRCFVSSAAATSERGAIVSRRVMQSRHRRLNPESPSSSSSSKSNAKANDGEKPWPESMVRASYVAAATLIPYFGMWFFVSNPTLRSTTNWFGSWAESADNDESTVTTPRRVATAIRRHFGEFDPNSVSYADRDTAAGDYRFPLEASLPERSRQEAIDHSLQHDSVAVLVNKSIDLDALSPDLVVRGERHILKANVPVNVEQLQELIGHDGKSSGEVTWSLSFPPSEKGASSEDSMFRAETVSVSDEQELPRRDPFVVAASTYSPWNYLPPLQQQQGRKQSKPLPRQDALEKSRLEYEVQRLEKELQSGSHRSVDSIMEELEGYQKQLRQYTWQKWMPW